MQGRSGRRRIVGGGSVLWLGIGVLGVLGLIARRHEKTASAIRAAYTKARERFGSREQPTRHDTNFPSEQEGEFLGQESPEEETEVSTAEAEEDPGEEAGGVARESARRSEEGDDREEQAQDGESAAVVEEGRSNLEALPMEQYDSLTVSQITQRLRELSPEEVEQLRGYEAENRNRRSIMQRFETRIRAARKNLEKSSDAGTEEGSEE